MSTTATALIVAALPLLWAAYKHFSERGRLKVSACGALAGYGPDFDKYIVVKATNMGQRTVTIESFKAFTSDNQCLLFYADPRDALYSKCSALPKRLQEGETAEIYMRAGQSTDVDSLKEVVALDSKGGVWKWKSPIHKH